MNAITKVYQINLAKKALAAVQLQNVTNNDVSFIAVKVGS